MIQKLSLPYTQRLSNEKYLKIGRPCVLQFSNPSARKLILTSNPKLNRQNSQKACHILQNSFLQKTTSYTKKPTSRRNGALSLPKIIRPFDSDCYNEYSNISQQNTKHSIRQDNSQQRINEKPKTIFHLKQPKFKHEQEQNSFSCKNQLYQSTIKRIKEMKQMNANQFCISKNQKQYQGEAKPGISLLLQRRGFNGQNQKTIFALQLTKSNFDLNKKYNNEFVDHHKENSKYTLKLKKYFTLIPGKAK